MSLAPNTKLGSYEILSPLGAGGMGEVYRARDPKLGREVAIKVLPEEFTQHPQKLARFEREARLLAALNHPGIATLHGLEEAGGKPFLVMELVEGETLAERISRGPLPLKEGLTLAQQIAEALDAAHEKGVIHRDLKPANIKVDPEGRVKVLDFGLAKVFVEESAETDTSFSPTLSRDATRAGVILGTAAYMSPEQAKGKTVDKRTDVFSFGIVLYEMLTGKRAFAGEDVSDVLARILASEPDWKALSGKVPSSVVKLLERCLAKDRRKRLRDIADAHYEIQEILAEPTDASSAQAKTVATPSRTGERVFWGLAVIVASLAVWALTRAEPPANPITRFAVTLPAGDRFTRGGRHLVALSPDGNRFVYVANNQLYLREMDQIEAAPIRGTDMDPASPFFSPNGEWIGFWTGTGGQLKKVSVSGGAPVTLCAAGIPFGASWSADDTIVFGEGPAGIFRVSANGGTPEVIVPMNSEKNEAAHGPQMLPDGKTILFTLSTGGTWDESQIVSQSLATGERRVLIEGGSDARYIPTGHLVYALGATLLAAPFDLAHLTVTGGSVPLVEGVARSSGQPTGAAQASFSESGTLLYLAGDAGLDNRRLAWVDRHGVEERLPGPNGTYRYLRLSPDGERLAVEDRDDIWIHNLTRGTFTRLTFTENNNYVTWTPDGERVIFSSRRSEGENLFWKAADGSDEATQLTKGQLQQHPDSTSPDGKLLAFHDHDPTDTDLWILSLEGNGEPQPLLQTAYNERGGAFSPNGRWLAYVSDESGRDEVYAQPFPGPGGKYQISREGGNSPVWQRDGRELVYRSLQNELMVVDVTAESGLTAGTPRMLFQTGMGGGQIPRYDIAPDGERFVMSVPEEDSTGFQQINLVLNWFEELKRLVPTD